VVSRKDKVGPLDSNERGLPDNFEDTQANLQGLFSIEVSGISSRAYRTGTSNEHSLPWFEVRSLYGVISDREGFNAGPNLHW